MSAMVPAVWCEVCGAKTWLEAADAPTNAWLTWSCPECAAPNDSIVGDGFPLLLARFRLWVLAWPDVMLALVAWPALAACLMTGPFGWALLIYCGTRDDQAWRDARYLIAAVALVGFLLFVLPPAGGVALLALPASLWRAWHHAPYAVWARTEQVSPPANPQMPQQRKASVDDARRMGLLRR
jgi:hypothetical protein